MILICDCGIEFEANRTDRKYCSNKCITKYGVRRYRENYKTYCKCGAKKLLESVVCKVCHQNDMTIVIKQMTLEDYQSRESVKNKHPSWTNAHIRDLNRNWNKNLTELPCAKCGYDKHVELCHIKALSLFVKTATLAEVNSPENIIQLCPNCHWEFDNLPRD